MRHFDFLGNELFDGDEVVTVSKNFRAKGGSLVKAIVRIDKKGKIYFENTLGANLYSRDITEKCVKVRPNVSCSGCKHFTPENTECIYCSRFNVDRFEMEVTDE